MTSIGETLRRERLRRHLELGKIAGELKISSRFLEAIEEEDFAKLPGGVFTKSFVRQYAAYLGLDAEELAAAVQRLLEPGTETPQFTERPKPDVPLIPVQFGEDWQSVGEHHTVFPGWLTAGGLLLALMLVCSGIYWWWERPHHQSPVHESPPLARVTPPPTQPASPVAQPAENSPADNAAPAASDNPSAPAAAVPQTEPPIPSPAAKSTMPVATPNPNATVRVAITADEPVWIRAVVNGKFQFSGVLQAHESRTIDADGQVEVRLGNAGGASLSLNGKPIGAVGPKGQPRTVQFTSGGFQIVSSKPPADALDRL
jgi:cytoskeletal protein RodZ